MGLTTEERLCFQRALDILDATVAAISASSSSDHKSFTEANSNKDDGRRGCARYVVSQPAPMASTCQQVEDLLRLCLDLLLVDGDVQRLLVLLEDDRLMCVLRSLLTTNPTALTVALSPSSSGGGGGAAHQHHPLSSFVDDDGRPAGSPTTSFSHDDDGISAFTPIAFSMLQANLLCVARDVLVAVSAAPAAVAMVAPTLRQDQWMDVLIRYLGLKKHRNVVEATLLEAIYVLSQILLSDAGTCGGSGGSPDDCQGCEAAAAAPSSGIVGDAELGLVLGRIQSCYHDVTIRNFAMGTLRLWVLGNNSSSSNRGDDDDDHVSGSSIAAVGRLFTSRDVIAARESIGSVMVWIFTTSAASEALRSGSPLPSQVRYTLTTAADVLSAYVLKEPTTVMPQSIQRHASRLLDALLLLHQTINAETALLVGRDRRGSSSGGGGGQPSETKLMEQATHVSMAIEVLVLNAAVMSRVASVKRWLLAVLLLSTSNSAFCRRDDGVEGGDSQPQSTVCTGITSSCARWLRYSIESFIAAGRFDEVLNAIHEPTLTIGRANKQGGGGYGGLLEARTANGGGVASASTAKDDGGNHPVADTSIWAILVTLVREWDATDATVRKPDPNIHRATVAQATAHQEAALTVGLLLVAGTRCPSRRALLCEMARGSLAFSLLRMLHALFLCDGHRGECIVRIHGSDGELLNSIRFVDAVAEEDDDVSSPSASSKAQQTSAGHNTAWNQPAALYDIVQFIVSPTRADSLNDTMEALLPDPQRHRPGTKRQQLSRAEWVERHHKLAVALFSLSVLSFLAA